MGGVVEVIRGDCGTSARHEHNFVKQERKEHQGLGKKLHKNGQ